METVTPLSFVDFPEDVQLCVLSFLRPCDLAAFASTCKRFVSLYRNDQRLWFSMCHRRWGSKTLINKWGSGKISYRRLYRILHEYDNLIGFWRRCGDASAAAASSPPLVFFEWGPFYITGSRISPSQDKGYEVIKKTFLWMSVASRGQPVNYLDPEGRFALREEDLNGEPSGIAENDLIQVNVNFIGESHVVVEENFGFSGFTRALSSGNMKTDEYENVYGSPPDKLMTEIYQYFANRTSPSGNGASRRQRRREKEKQGRMKKWEAEHFVKIVNCSPKPVRPLQGLWKGICEDMSLDFYLVSYDDVGGIDCRKIGDSSIPIFWTSSSTFIDSPLSPEEDHIYNCRLHLTPIDETDQTDEDNRSSSSSSDKSDGIVSRMLYINSCYDLVIPDSAGTTANPRHVEGRIWQYGNGTFGFGFLRDNYIIDLKHIAANGHILDTLQQSNGS